MTCERFSTCPFYNDKMPIDSGTVQYIRKNTAK